MKFINH